MCWLWLKSMPPDCRSGVLPWLYSSMPWLILPRLTWPPPTINPSQYMPLPTICPQLSCPTHYLPALPCPHPPSAPFSPCPPPTICPFLLMLPPLSGPFYPCPHHYQATPIVLLSDTDLDIIIQWCSLKLHHFTTHLFTTWQWLTLHIFIYLAHSLPLPFHSNCENVAHLYCETSSHSTWDSPHEEASS